MKRCDWAESELMHEYHDEEWGNPVHDDNKLFEFLVLETAQAGLSWSTVLKKRENYRKAFDNFNPEIVSRYGEEDINRLLKDKGIIRNRLKILSAINNAKRFLEIQNESGSFGDYLWNFVNHKPIVNQFENHSDIPATSEISDALSRDLKRKGFSFVGSTICYAFMQAIGMVNDHVAGCYKRQ